MKKLFQYLILAASLCVLSPLNSASAEPGHFSGYIALVHRSAELAKRSDTLESLQAHAQTTMAWANEFQQAAQDANDTGFVSQAVDIYNNAQRAMMSSSLQEAREYIGRAESYARQASDQAGITLHDPEARRNYNDPDDVSYRNYYDISL